MHELIYLKIPYLYGRECGDDGRRPESVCDEWEVRQVSLDAGVQDLVGPGVAERRTVLVQQVHQFLSYDPKREKERAG